MRHRPILVVLVALVSVVLSGCASTAQSQEERLRQAASAGDRESVVEAIGEGVEVDAPSHSGGTALMYAAYGDHADVVAYLLEVGADPDLGDRFRDPAINWAAYSGASAAVEALLKGGADATITTHHGDALAIAMRRGFPEIVETLVRHTQVETGDTALHAAARAGNLAKLEQLLSAEGFAIDAENRIGYTALMDAAREGHSDIVTFLLAAGADPQHRGNELGMGMTALHLAADRDRAETARILLEAGLAVDEGNAQGTTPLAWALGEGSFEVANVLLDAGADPSLEDAHGFSALDMVEYLEDPVLRERLRDAARR